MSHQVHRRALLMVALLSPAARAADILLPSPHETPIRADELLAYLMDEVLSSDRQLYGRDRRSLADWQAMRSRDGG